MQLRFWYFPIVSQVVVSLVADSVVVVNAAVVSLSCVT